MRIAVVAPSTPITPDLAERCTLLAREVVPEAELLFHPQCFLSHGHFAGTDAERLEALVEVANDPTVDAIWFARGGYGFCRIAEDAVARLGAAAHPKTYLGFSDAGFLLGALYKAGIGRPVHGPMVGDLRRKGGEAAVARALTYLVRQDAGALDPDLGSAPNLPFNLTVFSHLLGTPLQPDLTGHVLWLEDVSEHLYRIDRSFFHVTSDPSVRRAAGIRIGRFTDIPHNDPAFAITAEEIALEWCARSGIPFLGHANIGHDAANRIVPFGPAPNCS